MAELDLYTTVNQIVDSYMDAVHTAIPGTIKTYDPAKKTADVQPSIQLRRDNQIYMNLPLITDCPVIFSGTKDTVIQFPLKSGDECLIIFSEMSLERWRANGGASPVDDGGDPRFFSLTDGICIPGCFSPKTIGKKGEGSGLEILHKNSKVWLKDDGKILINGNTIELNGNSKVFVTHAELDTALQNMVTLANSLFLTAAQAGVKSGGLTLDISGAKTTTIKTGG